jgi:hypothetical protein
MGGGHNQTEWCNNFINGVRSRYPADSYFKIVASSESSKSACAPFNCPQYKYSCTVSVQSDPIYFEKVSLACPDKP